jgi:hypothetical protein
MVLVAYILDHYISILQTQFSERERHEARRLGLEPMPLDQHIPDGHGEREPGVEIRPAPMQNLCEMADQRQPGEPWLPQQTILPHAARTQFAVGRIAWRGMEGGIPQDNHPPIHLLPQPLQGVLRDSGGGARPPHAHPPWLEEETEGAANPPAMMRHALTADLLRAPARADGVEQLDPIRVDDAAHRRGG